MKNWQLITLIGLTASFIGCTTTHSKNTNNQTTNYARDSMGFNQSEKSIKDEYRRASDDFFSKNTKRINTDEWK